MSYNDAIEQFKEITGATAETANFFLAPVKGDVNAALAEYYVGNVPGDAKQQSSSGSSSSQQRPVSSISDQPTSSRATQASTSRKNKPQKGVINTMDSLRKNEEASADDDDDKPAEFYTGGEKSGLGVIDPNPKKASNARDLIQEIVRKAQATQPPEEEVPASSAFRGVGYTLGGEGEESRKIEDPNEAFRKAMNSMPQKVTRVLKLWKDGFSCDDGRLYRYDDPANKEYLEAINNGRAPLAVLNVEYNQPVDVHVEKRTDEDYKAPPKVYKPFASGGQRLGSEMPPTTASSTPATSASTRANTSQNLDIQIDDAQPITSLQIRLASGQRIVSRLNTSHTLADIYAALDRNAGSNERPYVLLTPFPRKEFARDDTTIEAAGLLKGVLRQKYT